MLITPDTYFPEKWNLTSYNLEFRGAMVARPPICSSLPCTYYLIKFLIPTHNLACFVPCLKCIRSSSADIQEHHNNRNLISCSVL